MTTSRALARTTATAALAAAALLLTGCMQGGPAGTSGATGSDAAEAPVPAAFLSPTAGEAPEGALADTRMTYVGFGGGYQDAQMSEVVEPFAAHTGATVVGDGPADLAKLRAQVESGAVTWDTVESSPVPATANCGTLFEPLDTSLIDLSAIPDELPTGECFVPIMVYAYTVFYDAQKYVENPPTALADFFDTEKYPGTRGIEGRATPSPGVYELALMADGVAPEELYPLDTDRALGVYDRLGEDVKFWTTGAEQTQLVQGGEVDMLIGWTGRIPEANLTGADFAPIWDHGIMDSDVLTVTKGSSNSLASHALINWFIGADQQTAHAEGTAYPPVNPQATPTLSPEFARFDVTDPEVLPQLVKPDHAYWAENYDSLTATWHDYVTH